MEEIHNIRKSNKLGFLLKELKRTEKKVNDTEPKVNKYMKNSNANALFDLALDEYRVYKDLEKYLQREIINLGGI